MKPIAAIVAALAGAALLPMHAHATTQTPQSAKYITLAQMGGTPGEARPDRAIPQLPGVDRDDHNRKGVGDKDHDRDNLRGRSGGTTPPGLDRDDNKRKGIGGDMDHDRDDMNRPAGTTPDVNRH